MNIALVGAHRKTKFLAPYSNTEWEIWSCSPSNESELPRFDKWFEIHHPELITPVYREWLKQQPYIYMQSANPDFPGSNEYPLTRVIKEFGKYFLTGTISYMMALAILENPKVIGLWGFGLCPEYAYQKSSIWHFIQIARDKGIEVISPAFPELLTSPPLYGYEWPAKENLI